MLKLHFHVFLAVIVFNIAVGSGSEPDPTAIKVSRARAAVYEITNRTDTAIQFNEIAGLPTSILPTEFEIAQSYLNACGYKTDVVNVDSQHLKSINGPFLIEDAEKRVLVGRAANDKIYLRDYPRSEVPFLTTTNDAFWPRRALIIKESPAGLVGTSKITPDHRTYDYGEITNGEKIRTSVILKNGGNSPVKFVALRTSCSCTTVSGDTKAIAPGESRTFGIQFDSDGKTGFQEQLCLFQTDDGVAVFRISGYVKPTQSYFPISLDFGDVGIDDITTLKIRVLGLTDRPVQPVISVSNGGGVANSVTHGISTDWNLKEDTITISLTKGLRTAGRFESNVKFTYWEGTTQNVAVIPVKANFVTVSETTRLLLLKEDPRLDSATGVLSIPGGTGGTVLSQPLDPRLHVEFVNKDAQNMQHLEIVVHSDTKSAWDKDISIPLQITKSDGAVRYRLRIIFPN